MPGAAFVTGGSSGIGFAVAKQLATQGHDIALFARDPDRLADAQTHILAVAPAVTVQCYAVDVSDRVAISDAVSQAVAALGTPAYAIASAGIAVPGLFIDQPLDVHDQHMAVNYFGALNFAHAVTAPMRAAGKGRIGLVSSAAAYFGIYGYSAYAPSKFALSGLAQVLHLELDGHGISVTAIHPSDTDTPQLEAEKRTKPPATLEITEGGGLWTPETVADRLIKAMNAGQPTVTTGVQMGLLGALASLIAPILRRHQRNIIRKHNR
ncbi:MAG: SDR family oxidoreductase [Shimia sp.]|uniref:SDR family oxidoreductase n=1 Tax=Shimia sp. TaxID=1954381 RepID=UPI004058E210